MQSAAEKNSSSKPLACMQRAVASANQRPLGRVPGHKTPRKTEKGDSVADHLCYVKRRYITPTTCKPTCKKVTSGSARVRGEISLVLAKR